MTLGQATCGCQARNVTSPTLPGKNRDHDEDEDEENEGKVDGDHIRNDNHADEDDEDEGFADNEDELQFAMHSLLHNKYNAARSSSYKVPRLIYSSIFNFDHILSLICFMLS